MPPIIALDTWNMRTSSNGRMPRGRCFVVAEGANTEYWYLSSLAVRLARKDLPKTIEVRPVKRTGDDKNRSHPRALLRQAETIREDAEGSFDFDPKTDEILLVFDADVYKGKPDEYAKDLAEFCEVADVAVTYPSFELFLLLHVPGAYEDIIEPHREALMENAYAPGTRRRLISQLANETFGMNLKSNPKVEYLAASFAVAAEQENKLNQEPDRALSALTSNVGKAITTIIERGR